MQRLVAADAIAANDCMLAHEEQMNKRLGYIAGVVLIIGCSAQRGVSPKRTVPAKNVSAPAAEPKKAHKPVQSAQAYAIELISALTRADGKRILALFPLQDQRAPEKMREAWIFNLSRFITERFAPGPIDKWVAVYAEPEQTDGQRYGTDGSLTAVRKVSLLYQRPRGQLGYVDVTDLVKLPELGWLASHETSIKVHPSSEVTKEWNVETVTQEPGARRLTAAESTKLQSASRERKSASPKAEAFLYYAFLTYRNVMVRATVNGFPGSSRMRRLPLGKQPGGFR